MNRRNRIILGCILVTLGVFMATQFLWLQFGMPPTESRRIWKGVLIGTSCASIALSVLCFYKGRK